MPRCVHCFVIALVALLTVGGALLLAQTSDSGTASPIGIPRTTAFGSTT